jgi:hypothetical protein
MPEGGRHGSNLWQLCGAAVATQRIGGAAFNLTVETDANLATPE